MIKLFSFFWSWTCKLFKFKNEKPKAVLNIETYTENFNLYFKIYGTLIKESKKYRTGSTVEFKEYNHGGLSNYLIFTGKIIDVKVYYWSCDFWTDIIVDCNGEIKETCPKNITKLNDRIHDNIQ
jgi:hypothetical protein